MFKRNRMFKLLTILTIFAIQCCAHNAKNDSKMTRLTYDVKPVNYNLKFFFDPRKDDFHGELLLDIKATKAMKSLELNLKDVNISDIKSGNLMGTPKYEMVNQTVKINFNSPLPAGVNRVKLKFRGALNIVMEGVYKYETRLNNKTTSIALATQMQTIFARKVFPCFDEPDRKATFEITLVIPSEYVGLSNMPVISTKTINIVDSLQHFNSSESYTELKFAKTPVMSTYTLAMAVGKFEYLERMYKQKIPIRIYTPIGKKIYGEFALNTTIRLLDFYTNLFGIDYPLPKLDVFVGLTTMENWGLVNIEDDRVLVYPNNPLKSTQRAIITIAKEIANLWFGNLVTMKWWNDYWLNGGLGMWVGYYASEKLLPEYKLKDIYKSKEESYVLSSDSIRTTRPVHQAIRSIEEIEQIFTEITHHKPTSLLNMLHDHMGTERFFSGLKSYLKQHKYSNTESKDLWKALSKSSGENVEQLMGNWINLAGYPMVHVRRVGNQLIFNQTRFLFHNCTQKAERSNWIIPLKIANTRNGSVIANITMPKDGKDFVLNCTESNIIVNPNRTAFIRVKYDKALLDNLVQAIKDDKLKKYDSLAVVDDLFTLAFNGHGCLVEAINVVKKIKSNIKRLASGRILEHLFKIRFLVKQITFDLKEKESISKNFDKLFQSIIHPMYQQLGWKSTTKETASETSLRPIVIGSLGLSGHKEVVEKSKIMFDKHYNATLKLLSNSSKSKADLIDANLVGTVFKIVVRNYGNETFPKLFKLYKLTNNRHDMFSIQNALAYTREVKLLNELLNQTFTNTFQMDDRYTNFIEIAKASPTGRREVWKYLKRMNSTFVSQIGGNYFADYTLSEMLQYYSGKSFLDEATVFFKQKTFEANSAAIKKGLELIAQNNLLLSMTRESLIKYLS